MRASWHLAATLAALLAGATLVGVPLVLLGSPTPASADSGNEVVASISNHNDAAGQLESFFKSHHFRIGVEEVPSSPSQVGSILAVRPDAATTREDSAPRMIGGPCAGGAPGCVDAIALPLHYAGRAEVLVGRPAKTGEDYYGSPDIFGPGELLECSGFLGEALEEALPTLRSLHLKVVWDISGRPARLAATPNGQLYVVGGDALSATSMSIRVSSRNLANNENVSSCGQRC